MPCNLTARTKRRLLIATPQGLKADLGAQDSDFEGTLSIGGTTYDLLRVYPDSSGYTQTEVDPEAKGARRGYGGYTKRLYKPWRNPEIDITAQMSGPAWLVLQELHAIYAASNAWITVQDYCSPDVADMRTAIAGETDPFTTRLCDLTITSRPSLVGNVTRGWFLPEPVKFRLKVIPQ